MSGQFYQRSFDQPNCRDTGKAGVDFMLFRCCLVLHLSDLVLKLVFYCVNKFEIEEI